MSEIKEQVLHIKTSDDRFAEVAMSVKVNIDEMRFPPGEPAKNKYVRGFLKAIHGAAALYSRTQAIENTKNQGVAMVNAKAREAFMDMSFADLQALDVGSKRKLAQHWQDRINLFSVADFQPYRIGRIHIGEIKLSK